jgi:hypothetical protein
MDAYPVLHSYMSVYEGYTNSIPYRRVKSRLKLPLSYAFSTVEKGSRGFPLCLTSGLSTPGYWDVTRR